MFGYEKNEDVYKEIKKLSKKFNLTAWNEFETIYIKSKFETWKFEIPDGNAKKIKLLHKNARIQNHGSDWHCQFNKVITIEKLLNYIVKHQDNLYKPKKEKDCWIKIKQME